MKKIIIFLFLLVFSLPLSSNAKEECRWVNIRPGLYCSTEIGNIEWQLAQPNRCESISNNPSNFQCCCGPQIKELKSIPTKSILITSIVAFFAILTALVFFYKKNE